jgi:hypothetical protein
MVKTENVGELTLNLPAELVPPGRPLTLNVNGIAVKGNFRGGAPVIWQAAGAKLEKAAAHCGPFKNAFRDPFLLVYGDEDDQAAAEKFRQEWWGYAEGWAPMKSAAAVTAADKGSYNLILFGTRRSNPLIGSIADQLPVELTPTGYRLGTQEIKGENLGLRLVWKSPWDAHRLICIQSGAWWGEGLPPNHLWDLIPDYIVYNDELDAADGTNKPLQAGYFDGNWNLPVKLERQPEDGGPSPAVAPHK